MKFGEKYQFLYSNNPVLCDINVIKFVVLVQSHDIYVEDWSNGTGYFCVMKNNLTNPITFKVGKPFLTPTQWGKDACSCD